MRVESADPGTWYISPSFSASLNIESLLGLPHPCLGFIPLYLRCFSLMLNGTVLTRSFSFFFSLFFFP